jgi:hypothetical protein
LWFVPKCDGRGDEPHDTDQDANRRAVITHGQKDRDREPQDQTKEGEVSPGPAAAHFSDSSAG